MIDKTGTVISPEFEDIRNFYLDMLMHSSRTDDIWILSMRTLM